mgnify:FL=1
MSNNFENKSWLGRNVSITNSADSSLVGRSGIISNETRETITILEDGREIVIGKNSIKFKFNGSKNTINGQFMRQRPEERIYRKKRSE